jgi:hypothetical protein
VKNISSERADEALKQTREQERNQFLAVQN